MSAYQALVGNGGIFDSFHFMANKDGRVCEVVVNAIARAECAMRQAAKAEEWDGQTLWAGWPKELVESIVTWDTDITGPVGGYHGPRHWEQGRSCVEDIVGACGRALYEHFPAIDNLRRLRKTLREIAVLFSKDIHSCHLVLLDVPIEKWRAAVTRAGEKAETPEALFTAFVLSVFSDVSDRIEHEGWEHLRRISGTDEPEPIDQAASITSEPEADGPASALAIPEAAISPLPARAQTDTALADSRGSHEPEAASVACGDCTGRPIFVQEPAMGSMDRPSQTDPIWTITSTQKGPIPVTRLTGEVVWINASGPDEPDDAAYAPEDELRVAEVTLNGRSELRREIETVFGGPAWPQAGAIVEPFRRYATKVLDVNAAAYRKVASMKGRDSHEVLTSMVRALLSDVFGSEWESSPGEKVTRTDWQLGSEGWKGREVLVIAGNDADKNCRYHQLIGDAIKYRYRFHDVLPAPIPGEPPGINLSNLEWWQYIGLNERHNLAMAIKPYLDDRAEYWQRQFIHEASAPAEPEGASGAARSNASKQSAQPESGTTTVRTTTTPRASASSDAMAMESPTRIRFEAGLAVAEVTLDQDLKDHGPSLEIARKYVVNATLTLARCILTPNCAEPREAIQRAYDFAEWFAGEAIKPAWVWLCVFAEMNTSGKLKKYHRDGSTKDAAPEGMSESEVREWHSCLYGVAHEALDEFVAEFWKERLKYFSTAAESLKGASPATSEAGAITTTGDSAGKAQLPAAEDTAALGVKSGTARQEGTKPRPGKERKGDASLLAGKRAVNFRTAEQYLGLTERQRQNLVKDLVLVVEGKGQNKKITTDSLRAYLPPENPN